MIAKINERAFGLNTLKSKVDYHHKKAIEKGTAEILFLPGLNKNLDEFINDCKYISDLNYRVKKPFNEVILSLPPSENLSNSKFLNLAHDYMDQLGYKNSCYSIVKHNDTDKSHLHILYTMLDYDGIKINDSYSKMKSLEITQKLESKYNLSHTKKGERKSISFGEVKAREYYIDKAIRKAIKGYNTKIYMKNFLETNIDLDSALKNKQVDNFTIKNILNEDTYKELINFSSKNKLFNQLYKQELLNKLDKCISNSSTKQEFINELNNNDVYIRMVSDKGNHKYVYGLKDISFYVKDTQLPLKYRYSNINDNKNYSSNISLKNKLKQTNTINNQSDNFIGISEKKNHLYTSLFAILNESSSYSEFKENLKKLSIEITEHTNKAGISGLSFNILGDSEVFKASDISRRLTYTNIIHFFENKTTQNQITQITNNPKVMQQLSKEVYNAPFINQSIAEDVENDIFTRKKKRKKHEIRKGGNNG